MMTILVTKEKDEVIEDEPDSEGGGGEVQMDEDTLREWIVGD